MSERATDCRECGYALAIEAMLATEKGRAQSAESALAAAHAALREACARYCAGCRADDPLEWVDPIRRVRKEDERPSWYHRLRPDDHPNGGLLDHCNAVELRTALSTPEGM